jgi:hypothetical protein
VFFFEAQTFTPQKAPDRIVRDRHATVRQQIFQAVQRQMRRGLDQLENDGPIRLEPALLVTAELGRRDAARVANALSPDDDRRRRQVETLGNRPDTVPLANRCLNASSQIVGVWFCHECRPPLPAPMLNQNPTDLGIP